MAESSKRSATTKAGGGTIEIRQDKNSFNDISNCKHTGNVFCSFDIDYNRNQFNYNCGHSKYNHRHHNYYPDGV